MLGSAVRFPYAATAGFEANIFSLTRRMSSRVTASVKEFQTIN